MYIIHCFVSFFQVLEYDWHSALFVDLLKSRFHLVKEYRRVYLLSRRNYATRRGTLVRITTFFELRCLAAGR